MKNTKIHKKINAAHGLSLHLCGNRKWIVDGYEDICCSKNWKKVTCLKCLGKKNDFKRP